LPTSDVHAAVPVLRGTGPGGSPARQELVATGERIRRHPPDAGNDLTAQELRIVRLARDGRTNPEIGGQLFLSVRTVEWHLRKVFAKLGISSRRELMDAMPNRRP
jgi:DNA-binding NarL/FixJ family response regulator